VIAAQQWTPVIFFSFARRDCENYAGFLLKAVRRNKAGVGVSLAMPWPKLGACSQACCVPSPWHIGALRGLLASAVCGGLALRSAAQRV
jgi:hypothetical protein